MHAAVAVLARISITSALPIHSIMSSLASFVGQVKATPWFQSTVKALEKREVQVAVGAGVAVLALGTLLLLIRRRSNAAGGRKDGAGSGKAKAGGNGSKAAPKPADNQYEKIIERDFITADGIGVDFSDVGGLDEQIRQIQELVIYPLSHREWRGGGENEHP